MLLSIRLDNFQIRGSRRYYTFKIGDSCFTDTINIFAEDYWDDLYIGYFEAAAVAKLYLAKNRYMPPNLAIYYSKFGDGIECFERDTHYIDRYYPNLNYRANYENLVRKYIEEYHGSFKH